ncbi:thioredoxin-dependent thiol peroxidase [Brassicibacter mesophilus]|uniref:thioredoxin-dependent thiol peroxidase n=1 Tax=Brassicibacter mesophilus TaxID=745119 RepID=UPI003D24A737
MTENNRSIVGDKAPIFRLPDANGNHISLADYKGNKNVVLYFYPKDNTPGCTVEASEFRDNYDKIESTDTIVIGISRDGIKSHTKFIEKLGLPFILLSDEEQEVHKMYDVLKLKKLYGKEYLGTERSTFLIDKEGVLVKEFRNVRAKGHAEKVIDYINEELK